MFSKKIMVLFIFIVLSFTIFSASAVINSENLNCQNTLNIIQNEIKNQNAKWTAGITSVSCRSEDEKSNLLGAIDIDLEGEYDENLATMSTPNSFDWRNFEGVDWTTPVKNQKNCGSCVAFGVIGAVESALKINSGNTYNFDLSEANLFFCGGGTCGTGWMPKEATNYLENEGVADETCFPYDLNYQQCDDKCKDWKSKRIKISDYTPINRRQIKQALVNYGPLIVCFDVYEDFFYYQGGVYEWTWGSKQGGHCVALVGYDDDLDCWIVKNSWGTNWGEDGWFRIKYYCKGGIDSGGMYVKIDDSQPPKTPSAPSGAGIVNSGESITFTTQTTDPERNGIYYLFDWGDGTNSEWIPPIASGNPISYSKTWSSPSDNDYYVKVKAMDVYGFESDWSDIIKVTVKNNPPLKPLKPTGPRVGKPDNSYTFNAKGTDPNGDDIYYFFDWGDGNTSGWLGPYQCEFQVEVENSWNLAGSYEIKVKVKDIHNGESEWSDPLSFSIQKSRENKFIRNNFFEKFPNLIRLMFSFFIC